MQAAINTHYGAPQVLSLAEMARPSLRDDQVLIEVRASTVTEGDRRLRTADYPGMSALFGRMMTGLLRPRKPVGGSTFAGKVVKVGGKVTRFRLGDNVFGSTMSGAYAECLALSSQEAVAKMPQGVSYTEAASIPYGGGTALIFLKHIAGLQAGERVLIVGASGGVGRMAVQVAKHLGGHVTGVCSSDEELVRELGADEVINYRRVDFTRSGQQWDVIFDTTQGHHFGAVRASLTHTGRYLSLYVTVRILLQMLWTKLRGGPRALTGVALGGPQSTEELRNLVEQGGLRADIARRFSLAQIREAHQFFESSRAHGTVVIEIGEGSQVTRRRQGEVNELRVA